MGFRIVHVYGLTETYGPISFCQSQPQWADLPAEQRAVLQARQGVSMIQAEGLRVVDARWPTSRPTAARWARSSCAATT